MKSESVFSGAAVIIFIILLLVAYGWIHNIVELITSADGGVTAMFILRCIGIFMAPLGAVLGYC